MLNLVQTFTERYIIEIYLHINVSSSVFARQQVLESEKTQIPGDSTPLQNPARGPVMSK